MLDRKIKTTLCRIARRAYPGYPVERFTLEIVPKEMKTVHGDYTPSRSHIRIYNLSRQTSHVVMTAIHELAHHIDCLLNLSSGHHERFYGIYKTLLETSVDLGVITADQVTSVCDANDIKMMQKHHGPIRATYNQATDDYRDIYLVKVRNAFTFKGRLSEAGYQWGKIEKAWCKEVSEEDLVAEERFLASLTTRENFVFKRFNEAEIEAIYFVVVHNGFDHRAALKQRGYYFKGYNFTGDVWVKRLVATELKREKAFLAALGDIVVAVKSC